MDLPKVLDLHTFLTARQDEVGTLLQGLKEVKGQHFAALPRHLRRRATSHKRYLPRFRANQKFSTTKMETQAGAKRIKLATGVAVAPWRCVGTVRPTNRLMRRRPELLASCSITFASCSLQLPEPAQRTSGAAMSGQTGSVGPESEPAVSAVRPWTAGHPLESHTWHARRMRMHPCLWGHTLALQASGKGHGSASLMQQLATGSLMHDATYTGCLQLWGRQGDIVRCLERITDSAHLHQQLACAEVLCGAAEWNLVVHRQGQFPRAALCPVRLLWVPRDTPLASSASSEDQAWYPDCGLWIWAHAAAFQDVAAELQQALQLLDLQGAVAMQSLAQNLRRIELLGSGCDQVAHQLLAQAAPRDPQQLADGALVWRAVGALAACSHKQAQADNQAQAPRGWGVKAAARNECNQGSAAAGSQGASQDRPVVGSASQAWLEKLGKPAPGAVPGVGAGSLSGSRSGMAQGANPGALHPQSAKPAATAPSHHSPQQIWHWPAGCVLGLSVHDPRLAVLVDGQRVALGTEQAVAVGLQGHGQHAAVQRALAAWPEQGDWTRAARPLLHCAAPSQPSTPPDSGSEGVAPSVPLLPYPMREASMAALRQQVRLAALHLPHSPVQLLAAVTPAPQPGAQGAGSSSSGPPAPSTNCAESATHCPLLLVRQQYGSTPGWSLIMPSGWVMPFWRALAHSGCRPLGQMEWRWVAAHAGRAAFPWHWPHTPAWQHTMQQLAQEQAAWGLKRPPGRVPPPACSLPYIPWGSLLPCPATPGANATPGPPQVQVQAQAQAQGPPATGRLPSLFQGWPPARSAKTAGATAQLMPPQPLNAVWQVHHRGPAVQAPTRAQRALSVALHKSGSACAGPCPALEGQGQAWFSVRVVGNGTCEEGAQLCWPATSGHAPITLSPAQVSSQLQVTALGYIVAAHPRGVLSAHCAAGVTFPGGLAVLDLQALASVWQACRAEWGGTQAHEEAALGWRAFLAGKRELHVCLRNPRAPYCLRCVAVTLVDGAAQ